MFTKNIRNWIDMLKDGELFFAKQTYADYFEDMQENTFYQLLARLCKEQTIKNVSKGLYYKPYTNNFERAPSEKDIVDFLTNKGRNGCEVGGNKYANYGIVNGSVNFHYVFTNILPIKSIRKINDLSIFYLDVDYRNDSYQNTLECLELIEHIDECETVNYNNLYNYFSNFASKFNQAALLKVILLRGYKKRVLAAVLLILEKFGVSSTIYKMLNRASKYYIPNSIFRCIIDPYYNDWKMAYYLDNKCYYPKMFPGVMLPKRIGYKLGNFWYDSAGHLVDFNEIIEKVLNTNECFVKVAVNSWGGMAFSILIPN